MRGDNDFVIVEIWIVSGCLIPNLLGAFRVAIQLFLDDDKRLLVIHVTRVPRV
jgi:hypothetical protein